jgi:membrane protease subunit HflC
MKKNALTGIIVLLVIFVVITVANSAFVVREGEQAVVTKFGQVVRSIRDADLYWKMPFVEKILRFDKRILEFDGSPNQIPTKGKKLIYVDTFARWQIEDPKQFLVSVRNEITAKSRLVIIDSATRTAITRHRLLEAVRNSNRPLTQDKEIEAVRKVDEQLAVDTATEGTEVLTDPGGEGTITVGREKIAKEILTNAQAEAEKVKWGVRLVDVKIKRINYGKEGDTTVRDRVFELMKSEREQIAQKYRSEGLEQRAEWLGRIQEEKNKILSKAYEEGETIKGQADAEAARVYAEAYGQDAEFYAFWKTLEIYRDDLAENSTMVISTDSDLFRYLRKAGLAGSR